MNDLLEFWSLPWHALQRSLASGFGAESSGNAAPGSTPCSASAAVPSVGGSWLARARSGAPQVRVGR